jgi:hypothetical protein
MITKFSYVYSVSRNTDFYNVGKIWCFNITKKIYYRIIWNKWFFNKRFVLYKLKKMNYETKL